MNNYTKMLEYFLENGISLSNSQILALQEKANDNLNIKIGDEFESEKKDPQMKQINPNTINEFKKLYPSIKKDEGKQGLYFMKTQAKDVGDDNILAILNKMKPEDVEKKLHHSQIYCYNHKGTDVIYFWFSLDSNTEGLGFDDEMYLEFKDGKLANRNYSMGMHPNY